MLPAPLPRDFVRARLRALVARLNAIAESEDMDGLRFFTEVAEQGWVALQLGRATLPIEPVAATWGMPPSVPSGASPDASPDTSGATTTAAADTSDPNLTPLDELILESIGRRPELWHSMARLANACDHDMTNHFRARVYRLRELGLLDRMGTARDVKYRLARADTRADTA